MIKKSFIYASTSVLRFVFVVAMVLVSKIAFAGNEMYGKWMENSDNGLEISIVGDCREKYVPYPAAEPRPCFGYLVYGENEDGSANGWLIMSLADLEGHLEITLEPAFDSNGAKISLRLDYKDNRLHVGNITNTDNAFAKSLDGKELEHNMTLEQLRNDEGSVFQLSEEEQADMEEEGDPDGPVYDEADTAIADTPVQSNGNSHSNSGSWQDTLMMIVFGVLYVAMICHMVFELFIRRRPYKKEGYTKADMVAARKEAGLPEEATDEDNLRINSCIASFPIGWKAVDDMAVPTTKKNMTDGEKCIVEAISLMPTKDEYLAAINDGINTLEANWKRQFNGSVRLIVLTIIVAGAIGYLSGSIIKVIPFFLISLGVYYMASLTPTFMLNKIALQGKDNKSFFGGMIAGVFAFIGSAKTITTVTKYTDGTKDVDEDHSQHLVFLALGLIILCMIAIFVSIWAIFSYLRNYLLYK